MKLSQIHKYCKVVHIQWWVLLISSQTGGKSMILFRNTYRTGFIYDPKCINILSITPIGIEQIIWWVMISKQHFFQSFFLLKEKRYFTICHLMYDHIIVFSLRNMRKKIIEMKVQKVTDRLHTKHEVLK